MWVDKPKEALDELQDLWFKSFGYWSHEDLEKGHVFRWVKNAEAISRTELKDTPQEWASELLRRQSLPPLAHDVHDPEDPPDALVLRIALHLAHFGILGTFARGSGPLMRRRLPGISARMLHFSLRPWGTGYQAGQQSRQ